MLFVLIAKFHIVILCITDANNICLLIEVVTIKQRSTSCNLLRTAPSVPKYLSLYASRETTLIKYILKNINIYSI
jgi:hypothetical protein